MQTVTLSENAVAMLRFAIKGWRPKNNESRLPAYRELAAAGIMEPVPGSGCEIPGMGRWVVAHGAMGWWRADHRL